MISKEEQIKKLLEEMMLENGGQNIQLGNFIIQKNQPRQEISDKQFKNSQSTQSNSTFPNLLNFISNETQDQKQLQSANEIVETPNNFIKQMFSQLEPFQQQTLDSFIEPKEIKNSHASTESNKSCIFTQNNSKKQQQMEESIFRNVYGQLSFVKDKQIKNAIEDALHEDLEQIFKQRISISESSNTPLSLETRTTITDSVAGDPLKTFLLSLMPQTPISQTPSQYQKQSIDFLYLYSSPLVRNQNGLKKSLPLLDTFQEQEAIMDVLIQENSKVKFMAMPARVDIFGEALDLMPVALHYSGHGLFLESLQQSYLLFEQANGVACFMTSNQIQSMLERLQRPILFVFVASCHSRLIGEVFRLAGAQHVICVNTKDRILDSVCVAFAKAFYHALIRGTQTICQAFKTAKNQLKVEQRFPISEENKFVLLTQDVQPLCQHNCQQWIVNNLGSFKDLSRQSKYKGSLPVPPPNFLGRQIIMQELLEKILDNKMVLVKGMIGIGKSAILKQISIYISDRFIYKDGVLYMNLAQCDSLDGVTSWLSSIILPHQQPIQSKNEMKQLIITQIIQQLKNQEILLILDNIDFLMHSSDRDVFLDFLDLILSNCNRAHLCLSSRYDIICTFGIYGKTVKIEGLPSEDSIQLLLSSAQREIPKSEIDELVGTSSQLSSQHELIQKLDGHPQAIILAAGLLDNYKLIELYQRLKKYEFTDLLQQEGIAIEEQKALKLAQDLSWTNLVDRNEKAAQFFAFLGLLPSGVSSEDLETIWGAGWESLKTQLIRSSLLMQQTKNGKTYFSLYPFTIKFAESKLEGKLFKKYHLNIIKHYTKKLHQMYQVIGTQLGENTTQVEIFHHIEPNIKWAILRELNLNYDSETDKIVFDSNTGSLANSGNLTKSSRRKNSDSELKKKNVDKPQLVKKVSQNDKSTLIDDEEDKDFNFPLTQENLEIMQKKYEQANANQNLEQKLKQRNNVAFLTNSVHSNQTFNKTAFDQSSDEPKKSTITENWNQRKSISNYQKTQMAISEEIELSGNDDSLEENELLKKENQFQEDFLNLPYGESTLIQNKPENIQTSTSVMPQSTLQTDSQNKISQINSEKKQQKSEEVQFLSKELEQGQTTKYSTPQAQSQQVPVEKKSDQKPSKQEQKKLKFSETKTEDQSKKKNAKSVHKKEAEKNEKTEIKGVRAKQDILANLIRSGKQKEENKVQNQNSNKNYEEVKKEKISQLILFYCQILLLIRRYNECLKFIQFTIKKLVGDGDQIFLGNLIKTKACVFYLQKKQEQSKNSFLKAKDLFIKKGCSLGVASCEAALGYIFLQDRELIQAKNSFENSLVIYENINHDFGRHFLNRWLSLVKNKISSLKSDRVKHIQEEKELIDNLKEEYKKGIKINNLIQKKHKAGTFILRWLGDTISIFIEPAWMEDSTQKKILNQLKITQPQNYYKRKSFQDNNLIVMDYESSEKYEQQTSNSSDNQLIIQHTYVNKTSSSASSNNSQIKKYFKSKKIQESFDKVKELNQIVEEEEIAIRQSDEDQPISDKLKKIKSQQMLMKLKGQQNENKEGQPIRNPGLSLNNNKQMMPCFKKQGKDQKEPKQNKSVTMKFAKQK